jgi:hypothetical protein
VLEHDERVHLERLLGFIELLLAISLYIIAK